MKNRIISKLLFALAMIIVGSVGIAYGYLSDPMGTTFVSVGIATIVATVIVASRKEKIKKDERTSKIGGRASSWTYVMTLVAISLLAWVEIIWPGTLDVGSVLLGLMMYMSFVLILFQRILMAKGDVE